MKELKEEWRDIENYPNYQVSNLGRVKSKERISSCCYNSTRKVKGKILKQNINPKGYYTVCLFNNGKNTKTVHKLVANAFLENKKNYPCINHKNGIKTDNRVENLEWCTYSHNIKEAYRLGLQKSSENQRNAIRKYCKENKIKPLIQFDLNNNFIKEWSSAVEVQRELGINVKNISQCVVGHNKSAGGFKWITKEQFNSVKYEVE